MLQLRLPFHVQIHHVLSTTVMGFYRLSHSLNLRLGSEKFLLQLVRQPYRMRRLLLLTTSQLHIPGAASAHMLDVRARSQRLLRDVLRVGALRCRQSWRPDVGSTTASGTVCPIAMVASNSSASYFAIDVAGRLVLALPGLHGGC